MIRSNYHTHCSFCDGYGDPEDFIAAAVSQGMTSLGFSSHAPLPFPNSFAMPAHRLADYVRCIEGLKLKYSDSIRIYLGLEMDFYPGMPPAPLPPGLPGLDYTIGSIHFVDLDEAGNPWPVDAEESAFLAGIERVYHGDARQAVERYYALIREMVHEARHDLVGHLDVIKKNNRRKPCFSEEEPWYEAAVNETLELIAEKSSIVEVNTAGIRKKVGLYPSPSILRKCKEFGVRLTVSSDAHHPNDLTADYGEVSTLLREIGYKEIWQLTRGGWEAAPLNGPHPAGGR